MKRWRDGVLQYPYRGSMPEYKERFYRRRVRSSGLVTFEVAVRETDLQVSAEQKLEKETRDLCLNRGTRSRVTSTLMLIL